MTTCAAHARAQERGRGGRACADGGREGSKRAGCAPRGRYTCRPRTSSEAYLCTESRHATASSQQPSQPTSRGGRGQGEWAAGGQGGSGTRAGTRTHGQRRGERLRQANADPEATHSARGSGSTPLVRAWLQALQSQWWGRNLRREGHGARGSGIR